MPKRRPKRYSSQFDGQIIGWDKYKDSHLEAQMPKIIPFKNMDIQITYIEVFKVKDSESHKFREICITMYACNET